MASISKIERNKRHIRRMDKHGELLTKVKSQLKKCKVIKNQFIELANLCVKSDKMDTQNTAIEKLYNTLTSVGLTKFKIYSELNKLGVPVVCNESDDTVQEKNTISLTPLCDINTLEDIDSEIVDNLVSESNLIMYWNSNRYLLSLQDTMSRIGKLLRSTAYRNRCTICGNPRSFLRIIGLCRSCTAKQIGAGLIPGGRKHCWG